MGSGRPSYFPQLLLAVDQQKKTKEYFFFQNREKDMEIALVIGTCFLEK